MWKANGRTDRRRTLTHDKSSHGLWPGELKMGAPIICKEFLLTLDTLKICDLNGNKDSHWDLSQSFNMITWLQGFLCQLTHGWRVQSNRSVISCLLPTLSPQILPLIIFQHKGSFCFLVCIDYIFLTTEKRF